MTKKNQRHQSTKTAIRPKKGIAKFQQALTKRYQDFLARRPHRSFRLTTGRDARRSLVLPGYFAFSIEVFRHLKRPVFFRLLVLYIIVSIILIGLISQENYRVLVETLQDTSTNIFSGAWGDVGRASLLVLSGLTGGLATQPTEAQQIYSTGLFIMLWLTTVWLLRSLLAGKRVTMRDGLYSSGAPLFATIILFLLIAVQLVPAALAVLLYTAASASGILQGVTAMAFFVAGLLLVTLSVYLAISSLFATVIITLPGMYPWRALQISGDLVVGRRLRILLRLSWAVLLVAITWSLVMLPLFLVTNWLQNEFSVFANWPIIPLAVAAASAVSTMYLAGYVYLLYRKVVDDDAAPA